MMMVCNSESFHDFEMHEWQWFVFLNIIDMMNYSFVFYTGEIIESQKDHILFKFPIPFVTLFRSYPSIKPLIFTTFIINMDL